MSIITRFVICMSAAVLAVPASADLRSLGRDYRQMLSNYYMVDAIRKVCPALTEPEMVARQTVEKSMQDKVGMQQFIDFMVTIHKSDIFKNAQQTVDELIEQADGCEDKRLQGVLGRIAGVHAETYDRFEQEPALMVKPRDVPVPLRRD